jgi:glycosyltransferase involved in cell wall biosynthesis
VILLAAAYQPNQSFQRFFAELHAALPDVHVVVVDDGSGPAYEEMFARLTGTVLRHSSNRGKGAALKTGLRHIGTAFSGRPVVCADPDGQHSIADIMRVAAALDHDMVLGTRRFDSRVPLRSRIGNTATRILVRSVIGRTIHDTQTGLRGYPARLIPWLLSVPGERFDYEMNIILYAARARLACKQVPVATIYVDGNTSSHFSTVADAARVYRAVLRFALARRQPPAA